MKNTRTYTITEIAKELGVTRQTIYYWIKKNWVVPKRDYRNYPIFSDKEVKSIKKWHRTLKNAVAPSEHNYARSSPASSTQITAPLTLRQKLRVNPEQVPTARPGRVEGLTWEEIQKTIYK